MYKEKIVDLIDELRRNGEKTDLDCIVEMVRSCGEYVNRVIALEAEILGRSSTDPEQYRQRTAELDKQRSLAHNALISNVSILNRLCRMASIEPIYQGDPDGRIEIGEFAFEIVKQFFVERRL